MSRRPDPLHIGAELPLRAMFYPLGFAVEVVTDSADVVAAATEAWGSCEPEFDRAAVTLRVSVAPTGALAEQCVHSKDGHLYSIVSDSDNFAHADLDRRFASVRVSQVTASDHRWLRWFFLEAVAYTMLAQRDVVMLHAACVARGGRGVLLCGATTAGKSTLSYACARSGWNWIADDCTCVLPESEGRVAIARSPVARFRPDAPQLFPELEAYAVCARPTGKIGIEVPMTEIPGVEVARRASVAALVFLDRRRGGAGVERIGHDEAVERLLADMPRYGAEVDALHERVVRRVAEAPAYRLRYESLADGVRLLATL